MALTEYVTRQGDRMDLIAYRFYGDALLYGPILEANREVLWVYEHADGSTDWVYGDGAPERVWFGGVVVDLPAGLVLYVPELELPQSKVVPPWKS